MYNTRTVLAAVVVLSTLAACGVATAQAPASSPTKTETSSASDRTSSHGPSPAARVEAWTKKQWNAAQAEWAKDKAKWADCQKQSETQNLSGRKSWSFLYQCMTG